MLCSMTGFARVEDTCEQGNLVWELRSVNHRYLEINFRLPEEVRRLETQLRKYLQTKLARGKVDCVLRYQHCPRPKRKSQRTIRRYLYSSAAAMAG